MRTIPLTACPVCAAEDAEDLDAGEGHSLRRCRACGTVFAPEYADPAEVYTEGYLLGEGGAFGLDLSHPRFHAYLVRTGHRRLAAVERVTGVRRGSLCDVGCGAGELLEAAVARGWHARGVEPLPDASARARSLGLDVVTGTLEESGLPEGAYDVVSAFHVLEHMPSATAFLATLARWARPGGHVVVESPNWDSVQRLVQGGRWMALRPLEHLIHLTPESLRRAFAGAGLEPVSISTTANIDDAFTLDEYLLALGRSHWRRALVPLSRGREIFGRPATVPVAPARWLLRAVERRDARRGRGAALLGVARRPGAKRPGRAAVVP